MIESLLFRQSIFPIKTFHFISLVILIYVSGKLLGVTATCALELGVDVGSLDVTLHLGHPGTISSFWQQAGRAGRSGREATSILICFDSPVDQFYARNPSILFSLPPEGAIVYDNCHILRSHLISAAKELPLNYDWSSELFKSNSISNSSNSKDKCSLFDEKYVTQSGSLSSTIDPLEFGKEVYLRTMAGVNFESNDSTIPMKGILMNYFFIICCESIPLVHILRDSKAI
jgi:ATP-dependent helicase YprA (DUF1998 family)